MIYTFLYTYTHWQQQQQQQQNNRGVITFIVDGCVMTVLKYVLPKKRNY
jgi:hypothetical protein